MTTLGSFFNLDFSVSSYCNPAEPARGATGGTTRFGWRGGSTFQLTQIIKPVDLGALDMGAVNGASAGSE